MYNLFLDDFRNPIDAFYYKHNKIFTEKDWVIVRNYNEFVNYITENGLPDLVSFDHDLADVHYEHQSNINYDNYDEKTGYDCAKWLVEYCIDNNLNFPDWYIHSMNRVGSENIYHYIGNYLRTKKDV